MGHAASTACPVKLFVYHTPEQTPADALPDCAVVIDVLRATTTLATALHAGAQAVRVFSDIDSLMQASEAYPSASCVRAGERGGAKVEGCDLGNSPLDATPEHVGDKQLLLSTTNGTRAFQRVERAATVIGAALINRERCVSYLRQAQPQTVWLVGSGWQGSYSLEDTLCAGAIADALLGDGPEARDGIGNDETVGAIALYRQWQNALLEMFRYSSHGQRLLGLGGDDDLAYCARLDALAVLPIQQAPGVLVAQSS